MDQISAWWTIIPVSAVVSALVTFAIRFFDKPRPRIRLIGRILSLPAGSPDDSGVYGAPITLHNYGNGSAFGVRLAGSGCVVGVRQPKSHLFGTESWADHLHAVEPGQSMVLDVNSIDDFEVASIVVTWDRFPSLPWMAWARVVRTFHLRKLPVENPLPPSALEAREIPWFRRSVGAIGGYTASAYVNDRSDHADDEDGAERVAHP